MKKKSPALTTWFFTYQETVNNECPPAEDIVNLFANLDATHYAFQLEKGNESLRLHWQGNVKFKKPITGPDLRKAFKSAVRKTGDEEWRYFGKGCLTTRPCHDVSASTIYCLKEETRVDNSLQYLFPSNTYLGKDLVAYESMYSWQKSVYDLIIGNIPDERAIHLICDPLGNSGKSTLAKGLAYNHDACVIPLGLTSAQMKSAIVGNGPKSIYIIDLPRNNKSFTEIFDTIEEIKRGFVISCFHGKLQQMFMTRPHIVCFTNEFPDLSYLSFDMWRLYTISASDKSLVPRDKLEERNIQNAKRSDKNIINRVNKYQPYGGTFENF